MAAVTQQQVAEATGVHRSTVSRVLRGDARISARTRRRVLRAARQFGYDVSRLRATHTRQALRLPVDLAVGLEVHLRNGEVHAWGSARVTDLSAQGARLTDLSMSPASVPLEPFRFRIEFRSGGPTGIRLFGDVVHVAAHERIQLGVWFVSAESDQQRRIERWVSKQLTPD